MASHIDSDKEKRTYPLRIPVPREAQAALRAKNLIRGLDKATEKARELRPKLNEMIGRAVAEEYLPLSDEVCEEFACRSSGWVAAQHESSMWGGSEPTFEAIMSSRHRSTDISR